MKRVILGIGWFGIFNFTLSFIGGGIAGFMAGSTASGAQAGLKFGQQYGPIIFIVSALVAIIGTVTGILPYTKKDNLPKI
ncbi:MAG: hypothetical protein HW384_663 [Dehalococcoidia bacterium]|nr:hypothetical protein [Dehalococcoidia bacterium]